MPRPNPRGYEGGPETGTFLRQFDGHISTDPDADPKSTTQQQDEVRNAHRLGDDELI